MKKILIALSILFLLTGCNNIKNTEIEELVSIVRESKLKLSNQYRKGYKFYLPSDLQLKEIDGFNEIVTNGEYKYYMYVDLVSYYNNIKKEYKVNENCYISKIITYNEVDGYLEVNEKNDKYLIEIMYNYAKIELIVDKDYLKEAVTNSMIVLSTIKYNNDIIKNMMGEDILQFNEEHLNIFETNGGESNFLEYVQEYDAYEGEVIPDTDLIN